MHYDLLISNSAAAKLLRLALGNDEATSHPLLLQLPLFTMDDLLWNV